MRHGLVASPIALLLALVCARAGQPVPAAVLALLAIAGLALGLVAEGRAR